MLDIVIDTLMDSIKMLPFLFLSYFIIELIEHKSSENLKKILSKSGKYGPISGAALGLVPQCGFSVTASNLYSSRVITLGTLLAVFLATSDEAIPVLLSYPNNIWLLIKILIVKFVIALVFGVLIDFVLNKMYFNKKDSQTKKIEQTHEHIHEVCSNCHCEENGIFVSTLKHTINVFLFIIIVSFILNTIIHLIGEENLSKLLMSGTVFQPVVAGLIGLIPNCASSVLLTKLYIAGKISFGAIISGLATGAGIGLAVLFKSNHNQKENLKILGILYILGVFSGIVIQIIESVI